MSLDIGEIGVKVQVRDPHEKAAPALGGGGCGSSGPLGAAEQDELVRQCVRLVLEALQRRQEQR